MNADTPQRDVPREPPEGWRSTRGCGYHHYTPENIAAIVRDLKACEQGTESPEWINRDHRTACGVLWRVISALAFDAAPAAAPAAQDDGYCLACVGDYCTAKAGCVAMSNPPPTAHVPCPECGDAPDIPNCGTCGWDGSAAAPAAPAPDADASAGLVEALRICWNKHCATHMNSQRARAADLIEQQARELARVTRLANINRMCVELAKDEPEPPTESVGSPVPPEWPDRIKLANALIAARAAIAAADADAARYRFLRMSPTQLGWDADYRPDEVDAAIDAARAAMGEK